jgi:flagellar hook assembly protein FlgD
MVKVLANRVQPAGTYSVEWDGTSQSGQKLASGIYFYKLSAGENTSMKKMVMLK